MILGTYRPERLPKTTTLGRNAHQKLSPGRNAYQKLPLRDEMHVKNYFRARMPTKNYPGRNARQKLSTGWNALHKLPRAETHVIKLTLLSGKWSNLCPIRDNHKDNRNNLVLWLFEEKSLFECHPF